jgi:putative DNA primase/helicase
LQNGLLDVRTRQLRDHSPDYLSTTRIPVSYDANAVCPAIRKFFSEVHHSQDIQVVEEITGNCLTSDNSIQKAVLNVGDGDNGKSTELSLLKVFIGADNCSNVPWHALELNRFAVSALDGKLANIFADLPSQSLSMVSSFKMLTGGDAIGTEKKFGDYYSFVNHAKLIFSANKPPKVKDEDSYAFWRRWIILDFPYQIPEDKKDPHILDKLTTPEELSGLLNIALDGLNRLRANGRFSYNKSVEDTTEYYLRAADPVYAFLQDCVEVSLNDYVIKDDLYATFQKYCVKQCLPVSKPNSFGRSLQNQTEYRIHSARPEIDGERVTVWQGIKLCVKDVKDVNVISLSKGHAGKNDDTYTGIKLGENPGNPDAPASDTHEYQNPDTTPKKPDENGPSSSYDSASTNTGGHNDRREAALGMPLAEVIELWRAEGAPIIHLGPGENCEDLGELLSRPQVPPEHLEAVKTWLQEHTK